MNQIHRLSLLAIAAAIAACSGGNSDNPPAGTGTLRVAMTDAPACGYDAVNVTVTKVRIHRSESATNEDSSWSEIAVTPERKINLLDLQNGILAELGEIQLAAGRYSQVRLVLASEDSGTGSPANSLVLTDDSSKTEISLRTPSAQQSGLKLVQGFDVAANETTDLVLDFDACRSVVKPGNSGNYNLKPVISVIPVAAVGKVEIGGALGATGAGATVSAQVPDATGNPVIVKSTMADALGSFTLSPITVSETGIYTLVVTKTGYATHVIAGVPASAGALTTIPIFALQAADNALVSGTVAVPDALNDNEGQVRAIQKVGTDASAVEIASSRVDNVTRTYSLEVSKGPARLAAYSSSALTFGDGIDSAIYELEATIADADLPPQSATLVVSGGAVSATLDFSFAAAP